MRTRGGILGWFVLTRVTLSEAHNLSHIQMCLPGSTWQCYLQFKFFFFGYIQWYPGIYSWLCTPTGAQGTIVDAQDKTRVGWVQSKYPTCCVLLLQPSNILLLLHLFSWYFHTPGCCSQKSHMLLITVERPCSHIAYIENSWTNLISWLDACKAGNLKLMLLFWVLTANFK